MVDILKAKGVTVIDLEPAVGPPPDPESGEPVPDGEPTPEPVADPRSDGDGDEMFPDLWTTPAEAGDEPDLFA